MIRSLCTLDEYRACAALQEEIWGAGFSERVPPAILKVGQSLGGVTAGGFDAEGRLVGFVFGLTGPDGTGEVVHWSDMLAVRHEVAGAGLATRLKAFQRDRVMALGVRVMLWTFDPLRARNGHLNLNKLGAVVREYRRDMYGDTDSTLHRRIGTDRFVARWLLDSAHVRMRLSRALERDVAARGDAPAGVPADRPAARPAELRTTLPAALTADGPAEAPRPGVPDLGLESEAIRVAVPSDIGSLMERDAALAVAWREATREVLMHYLERGYEVRHLLREDGCTPSYLLSRLETPTPSQGGNRP